MNGVYGYKTKKELKADVKAGIRPRLIQTGFMGDNYKSPQPIVGPCPHTDRRWYAEVWLDENGRICKVK